MKNKVIVPVLILMFAVTLGAGVVAGKLTAHPPAAISTTARGTLDDVLQLSPSQHIQMQHIWDSVRGTSQECVDQAQKIQADQDKALMEILTDEQKAKYEQLTIAAKMKVGELERKRTAAFKKAVADTNSILNASQREIYESLIRDRIGGLPSGGGDRP